MRDKINKKFESYRQKWIYIPMKTKQFSIVLDDITKSIRNGFITSKEAIELIHAFKRNGKGWIKFKTVRGRKKLFCECEIILESNKKIKTNIDCEFILNSCIMSSSPKSLRLYKNKLKRYAREKEWSKPDDSFIDPITEIPAEIELTELGYEVYKDWQLEIQRSGMTSEEYKRLHYNPHGSYWRS